MITTSIIKTTFILQNYRVSGRFHEKRFKRDTAIQGNLWQFVQSGISLHSWFSAIILNTLRMYQGFVHLHNLLRWVILILLVIAIVRHFMGMTGKKPFTAGDKKTGLFLMIAAHIQFVIGLYQWIAGPWGLKLLQNAGSFGEVMKNPVWRFWTVEHNTGMLLAIILITIGRGVSKKNLPDTAKHKKTFWLFLIALIFILVSVPWPGREVARPIFPGMH